MTKFYLYIVLPSWLGVPHDFEFTFKQGRNKINCKIDQLTWKFYFGNNPYGSASIISEFLIIDRKSFNFKNELDFANNKKYRNIHYEKLKTLLKFSFSINKDIKHCDEELLEIWKFIKNQINKVLLFYSYFRILANLNYEPYGYIGPLSDSYYTRDNTFLYYQKDDKTLSFDRVGIVLQLNNDFNYPPSILDENSLNKIKEIMEKDEFGLRTEQNLYLQQSQALLERNYNMLVISLIIQLEQTVSYFLQSIRSMTSAEMNISFKQKGLNYFLEEQLPKFLDKEFEMYIKSAIDIYGERNEIVHGGKVLKPSADFIEKIGHLKRLIHHIKSKLESLPNSTEMRNFNIGMVKEIKEGTREVLVQENPSLLHAILVELNSINSLNEDIIKKSGLIEKEAILIQPKSERISKNTKFFKSKRGITVVFKLNQMRSDDTEDFIKKIITEVEEFQDKNIKTRIIGLGVCIPQAYKKVLNSTYMGDIKIEYKYVVDEVILKLKEFYEDKNKFISEDNILEYLRKDYPYFQGYKLYFHYQHFLEHKSENGKNYYKIKKFEIR